MEPILSLPPAQFRAALAELNLPRDRADALRRQYRLQNSPLAGLYGLLDRAGQGEEGMEAATFLPVSRPEGMSVADAIRSGEAGIAVPQGLLDAVGGVARALDAPSAAAAGLIPREDMVGEALNVAGAAQLGGAAMPAPRGALRSGLLRSGNWIDDIQARYPDVRLDIGGNASRGYTISRIVVPEDMRNQGLGSRIMREITDAADREGATIALSPSADFGGNVSRLRQFYGDLGFVQNAGRNRDFEISESMYRLPQPVTDTPAQRVARLLRNGRADEVTDDLMAQVDPQEMYRLYVAGETGMDLPMDEASRMARAREMGFDTAAYHATRATEDFAAFRPGVRGSVYMAATPDAAMRGASGQALENLYAPPGSQSVTATLPLNVRSSDIEGLGVNAEAWRALPEVVDGDDALRALQPQIEGVGAQYWDDVYLSQPRGDVFRYYRNDPPAVSYADLEPGRDVFGYRLPGWNSGSDVPYLNRVAERGRSGFLVSDEAGSSIVASPTMPIRSRFARFDPRLSHLANLNAANIDPLTGAAAMGASQQQQDPLASLRAYLAATGGVLGR